MTVTVIQKSQSKGRSKAKPSIPDSHAEALMVGDVARLLRLSDEGVRNLITKGALPCIKIGGARRILRSDLNAFLARCREEA